MSWNKQRGAVKVTRETHHLDAAGQPVGRLASRIALLLMGKHKPSYVPHIDQGDFVKLTNANKVEFTGKKWQQKVHFRTSNRPGGLKRIPVAKLHAERPAEIIRHAVKYMLPKNRTQKARMKRLTFTP